MVLFDTLFEKLRTAGSAVIENRKIIMDALEAKAAYSRTGTSWVTAKAPKPIEVVRAVKNTG